MQNEVGYTVADWKEPPFPPHSPLDGCFCRLEPLNTKKHLSDLDTAYRSNAYDALWTYLPYGPFQDIREYQHWLDQAANSVDPQYYAIIDISHGKAVGVASYLRVSPGYGSIEVGHLCFSSLLKKTPVATEAMYLMMKNAFDLGYRRYEWKCDSLNKHSCRAAERLGFTFEGIFRQAAVVKGRNRDTAWFSVLDKEWAELQKAFEAWLSPSNFSADGTQKNKLQDFYPEKNQ